MIEWRIFNRKRSRPGGPRARRVCACGSTTNQTGGERRSRRLHPAWLILIACCFLQAGGMGTINNAAGIMVPAVLGDLQFSQGNFMLYFTIQGLCMTAALPVAGSCCRR
ncbi:MAG: hypothetical protein ACLSVD_18020 [Eggerthellaceae bacterium]